jgi:hypothetical protein
MVAGSYKTWDNNTASSWWKDPGLRRNVLSIALLYWCVFAFGYVSRQIYALTTLTRPRYDGSLLSGLQPLPAWKLYFDYPAGSILGIISASY